MEQVSQKRQLKMHPKLLLDVIGRQAGSLDKALLEGGMNGIEAINALEMNGGKCTDKAIYFTYTIDNAKSIITIKDGGKGITTKKEIEEFFETFGTPHDESEHKIYAQFRMGRGQMFNFGRNVWRTGTFELIVDVLNNGLEWELKENLPFVEGCHITIELYDKYKRSWPANTVDCLKEAVKTQMEYVSIPVYFNAEQISFPPESLKWDFEDEFAYYSFNIGDHLAVYNLGVFVCHKWQTNGIIVSKEQLKVNFPRNDIMADCPIWYHIEQVVRKNVVKKSQKSYTPLTTNERRAILKDVRNGQQSYDSIKGSRILQTAQDKYLSFSMFLKNKQPWTFGEIGNRSADTVIQQGSHVVFAEDMIRALGYSGERKFFFNWLLKTLIDDNEYEDNYGLKFRDYQLAASKQDLLAKSKLYESFETAVKNIDSSYKTIAYNKMTKIEKRIIQVLEDYRCWDKRVLRIGISGSAEAWTDGRSYITLERNFLKRLNLTADNNIAYLFSVMTHEMAHDGDTTNTDIHGDDFYEKYHNLTLEKYGNPFAHLLTFKLCMEQAQRVEARASAKKRQKDKLEEKAKKLGILSPT